MIVKVCGITNAGDALAAVDAGASAVGFIFYAKSPRYVSPAEAARMIEGIPAPVLKVGVFVDETPRRIADIAAITGIDIAQLHGAETAARVPPGVRCWKAFRMTAAWKPDAMKPFRTEAFLLDSPAQGQTFDWRWAANLEQRIILAGGLDETNVRDAINAVAPWGVDACSRIESRPGVKDRDKMRRFVRAALNTCT